MLHTRYVRALLGSHDEKAIGRSDTIEQQLLRNGEFQGNVDAGNAKTTIHSKVGAGIETVTTIVPVPLVPSNCAPSELPGTMHTTIPKAGQFRGYWVFAYTTQEAT